jgi:hypothetical protein
VQDARLFEWVDYLLVDMAAYFAEAPQATRVGTIVSSEIWVWESLSCVLVTYVLDEKQVYRSL